MKRLLILCAVSVMFFSCAPMSKEAYMERYAEFMAEVAEKASSYTESDWVDVDEEFAQFSNEWYTKFEPELTFSEKMKIAGYQGKYYFYRGTSGIGSTINDILNSSGEILEEAGSEVSSAMKHLEKELEKINVSPEEAEKLAKELAKDMEDLENDLENDLEDVEDAYDEAVKALEDLF